MKKKLIIFNTIIVTVALLLMFGLGILVTQNNNYELATQRITELTYIYAGNYSEEPSFIENVPDDVRLTVVDATGKVLADSEQADVSNLDNHINREEIIAALNGKPKTVTRYSDTVGKNMLYYAEKVDTADGYVFVRVSIPVKSVNAYILKTIPLSLGILAAALLCAVLASLFLSSGLIKPLKAIGQSLKNIESDSFTPVLATTDDQDVNAILTDINGVGEKLHDTIRTATNEKERLDFVINNVSDGIVVLDNNGEIGLINSNAADIFGVKDAVGKQINVLSADESFVSAMADCAANGKNGIFEYSNEKSVYLVAVRRVENGLTIAVLSDITATKNAEKTRSDFFANASHELKTPLTSIKGFNEMIALNSKDEAVLGYSAHIEKEIARILVLIDDMLNLSKLENDNTLTPVPLNAEEIALDVADSLSGMAKEKDVEVSVSGGGIVFAEREHLFELVKNLVENGIRYNNAGGKVDVSIDENHGATTIKVADNGIGIDDSNQARIFERFYRVDKSRSRETGGTGLGLAIVKHVAELYGAELSLKSKLGVGTTVTVTFTKKQ